MWLLGVSMVLVVAGVQASGSLFNCNNPGNSCENASRCDFLSGRCICDPNGVYGGDRCHRLRVAASGCILDCGLYGSCQIDTVTSEQYCFCDTGYREADCKTPPYSCECSSEGMTATATLPGDFGNGQGYEVYHKGQPECATALIGNSNTETIRLQHIDQNCGSATRKDRQNGGYSYSRMFIYRYTNSHISSIHDVYFQCTCIYDGGSVLFTSIGQINSSPQDNPNVLFRNATNTMGPVSYRFTDTSGRSVNGLLVKIGDLLKLSVSADTGFCVVIDEIVASNGLTAPNAENEVLMQANCLTSVGKSLFGNTITHDGVFKTWDINVYTFAFDHGSSVQFAISYRTSTNPNDCVSMYNSRACFPGNRKKREATNTTMTDEQKGEILEVIYIETSAPPQPYTGNKECKMSSSMMAGLIAMAAVICVLLIICFVIGMRMITARKHPAEHAVYRK